MNNDAPGKVKSGGPSRVARGEAKAILCSSVVFMATMFAVPLMAEESADPHWAFKPLGAVTVPSEEGNQILDAFIEARLTETGLSRAPRADRRTLIRRLFLAMHGLPPTPERVKAFLQDPSPAAYARLVDEVLASPRYGERWAQHWLDIVRYADTHGYEVNTERPNAWPYRDYVIRAFNEDKAYDRFVFEQLAGDAVGEDAATGFLVAAAVLLPGQIGQDEASKRQARQDELSEIVIGTSDTFLALSVGCARCHDHKSDPIAHEDYYAMQAFFAGVEYGERPFDEPNRREVLPDEAPSVYGGVFRQPDVTHMLRRGDPEQPGARVEAAVLPVLGSLRLPPEASDRERRAALARWIIDPGNPLTVRVIVNRIWQLHFGHGLVETASDFGINGAPPSHPQLLDWLAAELVRGGWSMKQLHRRILLSDTYCQSSRIDPAAQARDSDNRLLWRFSPRRMEAEAIRDGMLFVSGRLNLATGGRGFDFFKSRGGLDGFPAVETFGEEGFKRMIYAHKVRMEKVPIFGAFDCPDGGQATPQRSRSTTAIQALNLFNSDFVMEQARALARRVEGELPSGTGEAKVKRVYQRVLARAPSGSEAAVSAVLVREHGLAALCRVLYNSNEFLFLP